MVKNAAGAPRSVFEPYLSVWVFLCILAGIALGQQAYLLAQPGVEEVHDLHVWAMSTSDIALTAHLVMPGGQPDDGFLETAPDALHERYEITHPTIQIERCRAGHCCTQLPRLADVTPGS